VGEAVASTQRATSLLHRNTNIGEGQMWVTHADWHAGTVEVPPKPDGNRCSAEDFGACE
jgi:hypothetical protein